MEIFVDGIKDILERAAWTFAQAFLGVFLVSDLASVKGAAIAGLAAAISVAKTFVKGKVAS
tara:strand:+ start:907 stop:1089 length:183 start_codon:yes stop_codon:yes gene_type:complete